MQTGSVDRRRDCVDTGGDRFATLTAPQPPRPFLPRPLSLCPRACLSCHIWNGLSWWAITSWLAREQSTLTHLDQLSDNPFLAPSPAHIFCLPSLCSCCLEQPHNNQQPGRQHQQHQPLSHIVSVCLCVITEDRVKFDTKYCSLAVRCYRHTITAARRLMSLFESVSAPTAIPLDSVSDSLFLSLSLSLSLFLSVCTANLSLQLFLLAIFQ